jgi:hypothetical protein
MTSKEEKYCCDRFKAYVDAGCIALDDETGEFLIDNSGGEYDPIHECHICPWCGWHHNDTD